MSSATRSWPSGRAKRGVLLLGAAVAVVAIVFVASALAAPERGVTGGQESLTLVGVQGEGVGLHEGGRVATYNESGEAVWELQNAGSYFEVSRLDDGRILAGFVDGGYEDCGEYDAPCAHTGFRILDPDAADPIVDEYSYPVRSWQNSEVHSVKPLPSGNYILTDMEHETVRVVDLDADETVWRWNASSFYEAPPDPTRRDWLHINDVNVIGEGRYLVSVRNANQLLVIERGEGVVEVVNEDRGGPDAPCLRDGMLYDADEDGDVRCGHPRLLVGQHNPQWLGDGAVLVADSERSRIVELHRDEATDQWEIAWQLRGANDIAFRWPRDADRLPNGNTLITDSSNARVVEVTENGTTVWSAALPDNPYEADRLPRDEPVERPLYGVEDTGANARNDGAPGDSAEGNETGDDGETSAPDGDVGERTDVPVLTPLVSLLTTSMNLPHWFAELHVGTLFVGLGLGLFGAWDLGRAAIGRLR